MSVTGRTRSARTSLHLVILSAERDSSIAAVIGEAAATNVARCTIVRVAQSPIALRHQLRRLELRRRRMGMAWLFRKVLYSTVERSLRGDYESVASEELASEVEATNLARFPTIFVKDLSSRATLDALRRLEPDVMLQNGAGILTESVFSIPRLGTWNLHHGVLPSIRGGDSLLWALYEGRTEWVGCSLHVITTRLDAGPLIGVVPISFQYGEHPGRVLARATTAGAELLGASLRAAGAAGVVPLLPGGHGRTGAYRSFMNGWHLRSLWRANFHPVVGSC